MRTRSRSWAVGLVGALILAGPAAADWLITSEGQRLETRGPWRVKGRMVVFTAMSGLLSSLRLRDVDLEASREATAGGRTPSAPVPVRRREAAIRITGADIPSYRKPPPSADGADEEQTVAAAAPTGSLQVTCERVDNARFDGVEVVGQIRNTGRMVMTDVRVQVLAFDREGRQAGPWNAFLDSNVLPPDRSTRFRLPLDLDYAAYADVRCEATGREIMVRITSPIAAGE